MTKEVSTKKICILNECIVEMMEMFEAAHNVNKSTHYVARVKNLDLKKCHSDAQYIFDDEQAKCITLAVYGNIFISHNAYVKEGEIRSDEAFIVISDKLFDLDKLTIDAIALLTPTKGKTNTFNFENPIDHTKTQLKVLHASKSDTTTDESRIIPQVGEEVISGSGSYVNYNRDELKFMISEIIDSLETESLTLDSDYTKFKKEESKMKMLVSEVGPERNRKIICICGVGNALVTMDLSLGDNELVVETGFAMVADEFEGIDIQTCNPIKLLGESLSKYEFHKERFCITNDDTKKQKGFELNFAKKDLIQKAEFDNKVH